MLYVAVISLFSCSRSNEERTLLIDDLSSSVHLDAGGEITKSNSIIDERGLGMAAGLDQLGKQKAAVNLRLLHECMQGCRRIVLLILLGLVVASLNLLIFFTSHLGALTN